MKIKYLTLCCVLLFCIVLSSCGGNRNAEAVPQTGSGNPALDSVNFKISADPKNAQLYADRAAIYFGKNNFDAALLDLEKAIMMDSMQPAFYTLLTDVYLQYFKSWEALRAIQKASELFPADISILLKLSRTQFLLRQYDESLRTIDKILKIDPQNGDAYLLLGMNFKEAGDTVRAINSFQKAVNFNADLVDAWINLGQLYESRGNVIAKKYYESAIDIDPANAIALHAKADYLSRINDLNGALSIYRDIIQIDSLYDEAYFNSGLLYLDMDSIPEAFRQFDHAISVSPLHIRAHFYRGYCAEMSGDYDQARKDYRKALSFAPDYKQASERLEQLGNK